MAVECNVVTAGFASSLARTKFLSLPYHCCPRSMPVGTCARRHSESEIAGFFVRYFEEGPTLGPGQFALGELRIVLDRTCPLDGGLLRLEVIEYVAVAVGRLRWKSLLWIIAKRF
jgi:hypothetical protein